MGVVMKKQTETFRALRGVKMIEAWLAYHAKHAQSNLRKTFNAFLVEWNAKQLQAAR
jgi:hypothetical protein